MKILEMLRLSELGLSQREISQSAGCAKSTVGDTLIRCRNKNVNYQTALTMTDERLQELLFPDLKAKRKAEPDWEYIHGELARHKSLNCRAAK